MKGSNSRFSHRPHQRFSNTLHVQGGMVTDADLTEAGQLHLARDEAQNATFAGTGSPAKDGIVGFDDGPILKQGVVLAQGKHGRLVARDGNLEVMGKDLFEAQADLPDGPALPNGPCFLYADLWERQICAVQDEGLADAGLHGAETSYRTRTMVQIKALPLVDGLTAEQALEDLQKNVGMFQRRGNASVAITRDNTVIAAKDCDPCADQVDIDPAIPNALFRLEIVAVKYNGQGEPQSARFAWSMENAAAVENVSRLQAETLDSTRAAFGRRNAVYQYFSDTSETHIGRFERGFDPQQSEFDDKLTHRAMPFVRRWDGTAVLDVTGSTAPQNEQMGDGTLTAAAGKATLSLGLFTVEITFAKRALMAGDHWLIELRRFAPEDQRIRLVPSEDGVAGLPLGITHHFCPLFPLSGADSQWMSDAQKRQLTFPALTDIPASHVAYDPKCDALFQEAENVEDALNALCDLDATHVAFDPPDNCERFQGTNTVDEALRRLCKVQDDTMLSTVLRTMMDWGVVCGLKFSLVDGGGTQIRWTGGTVLDRLGRIIEVPAGDFDLRKVPQGNHLTPLADVIAKTGEVCLSIAIEDDGELAFFFSDRKTAFGVAEPTFREAVAACLAGRKWVDFGGLVGKLKEKDVGVVKKMADVWANRQTFDGHVKMSKSEEKVAIDLNDKLAKSYMAAATPERAKHVETLLEGAKAEFTLAGAQDATADIRRMQRQSAIFGIIAAAETEDDHACECRNALLPCPPRKGDGLRLVPVACFKMARGGNEITALTDICNFCCRKQAMSWRAYRYYQGSFTDDVLAEMKEKCCTEKPPKPGIDWGHWFDDWIDRVYVPREPVPIPLPRPQPKPNPYWPPIVPPDRLFGPRDPRITTPLPGDLGPYVNIKPDVSRLALDEADNLLTGNGFAVAGKINLDSEDLLDALAGMGAQGDGVLGREKPQPGDRVAILSSGGTAVDFVVLEKGNPKLPFETTTESTDRIEKVIVDMGLAGKSAATGPRIADAPAVADGGVRISPDNISGLEAKLKELMNDRAAVEAELGSLTTLRGQLAKDVEGLKSDMTEITALNGKLLADVEKSKVELKAVTDLRDASLSEIAKAGEEFEAVRKSHEELIVSMRREQPIESVLSNNPAALRALKSKGVVTVGDISSTNTNTLTTTLRGSGLTGRSVKGLADGFLKRR